MKGNWKVEDKAYVIEHGTIIEVKINKVKEKVIFVKDGIFTWGIRDDNALFRTPEEASKHIEEK